MDYLKILNNYQNLKNYHFSTIFEQSDLFVICLNSSLELTYINSLVEKLLNSNNVNVVENLNSVFTQNTHIGSLLGNKDKLLQQLKLRSKNPIQEKIKLGLRNVGFFMEKGKNEFIAGGLEKCVSYIGKEGTMGRFLSGIVEK